MRRIIIFFALLLMSVQSDNVFSQVYITSKVSKVLNGVILMNKGSSDGLIKGLQGKVYFLQLISSQEVRIDIALVEIISVDSNSARLKILDKTADVYEGNKVELVGSTISIQSKPPAAEVHIDGEYVGITPIKNKFISKAEHSILISCQGYESHKTTISTNRNESNTLRINLIRKTRLTALKKSLLFPGSGQRYAGYAKKGNLITLFHVGTIIGASWATINSIDKLNKYNEAKKDYQSAQNEDLAYIYHEEMQKKYNKSLSASNIQKAIIGSMVSIYLLNIIDVWVKFPEIKKTDNQSNILLIIPLVYKNEASIYLSVSF